MPDLFGILETFRNKESLRRIIYVNFKLSVKLQYWTTHTICNVRDCITDGMEVTGGVPGKEFLVKFLMKITGRVYIHYKKERFLSLEKSLSYWRKLYVDEQGLETHIYVVFYLYFYRYTYVKQMHIGIMVIEFFPCTSPFDYITVEKSSPHKRKQV